MRALVLATCLSLVGCGTLVPSVTTTSLSTAAGCAVGAATGTLPLGCVAGAALGDGVGEFIYKDEKQVKTVFGLLKELIDVAGWVIAVYILMTVGLPFLVGWFTPHRRDRRHERSNAGE